MLKKELTGIIIISRDMIFDKDTAGRNESPQNNNMISFEKQNRNTVIGTDTKVIMPKDCRDKLLYSSILPFARYDDDRLRSIGHIATTNEIKILQILFDAEYKPTERLSHNHPSSVISISRYRVLVILFPQNKKIGFICLNILDIFTTGDSM